MGPRRLSVICASLWLLFAAAMVAPGVRVVRAQDKDALTAADLAGLSFRNIGPAAMSGRSWTWTSSSRTRHDVRRRRPPAACSGPPTTASRGRRCSSAKRCTRSATSPSSSPTRSIIWVGTGERANRQSVVVGRRRLQVHRRRQDVDQRRPARQSQHIGRIVTHPTNPDIVYVAAQGIGVGAGRRARAVSHDWTAARRGRATLHVDEDTGVDRRRDGLARSEHPVRRRYQRRRSAFGFNGGGPGSALWKSTDGGATWPKLTGNGLPAGEYGRIGISDLPQGSAHRLRLHRAGRALQRVHGLHHAQGRALSQQRRGRDVAVHVRLEPAADVCEPDRHRSEGRPAHLHAQQLLLSRTTAAKTFTSPRTTLHGDDRFVWVNPKDSRHVIKLDDGGIGIWYDRGLKCPLRRLAAGVAVLPRGRGQRAALQRLRRAAGQRLLVRPERELDRRRHAQRALDRLCGGDGFSASPTRPTRASSTDVAVPGPGPQRHAHLAGAGHPPRRSAPARSAIAATGTPGATQRARASARQRHAPGQLGRARS